MLPLSTLDSSFLRLINPIIRVKFFFKKKAADLCIYHKRNIHEIHLTVECGQSARLLEKVPRVPVEQEDILLMQ